MMIPCCYRQEMAAALAAAQEQHRIALQQLSTRHAAEMTAQQAAVQQLQLQHQQQVAEAAERAQQELAAAVLAAAQELERMISALERQHEAAIAALHAEAKAAELANTNKVNKCLGSLQFAGSESALDGSAHFGSMPCRCLLSNPLADTTISVLSCEPAFGYSMTATCTM